MTPPPKKPKYDAKAMEMALADVALGVPKATAAKRHGVNRVTLLNKANGKYRAEQRMGPDATLSKEEEDILVIWIQSMSRVGYPVTRCDLLDSVQQLVKRLGRGNSFTYGRPGKRWYSSFIHRNPSVHDRMAENLTISRALVTKESLLQWYSKMYGYFEKNGFLSALSDPQRVFNCDESAFFLNPKGNRVLAVKGDKNVYQVVNSDEKECLTVLVTASAQGTICPPLIVLKYKRIPQDIIFSVPPEWGIGKSESGWMTSAVFYEFLANIFHPWLLRNSVELPVILFIDGHSSHVTLEASEFCDKNQIVLIALHPNATHLIQPLDVSLFKALKSIWKRKVHQWRMEHTDNPCLRKRNFAPLLNDALGDLTESTIVNGFRKSGLCPWNPQEGINALEELETQLLLRKKTNKKTETKDSTTASPNLEALKVFEANIPKQTLLSFKRQGEVYAGLPEDASLFRLWKTISSKCPNKEQRTGENTPVDSDATHVNNILDNVDALQVRYIEDGVVYKLDNSLDEVQSPPNTGKIIDENVGPTENNPSYQSPQIGGAVVVEYINSVDYNISAEDPDQGGDRVDARIGENGNFNPDQQIISTEGNASDDDVLGTIPSPFKKALIWTPVIQQAKKNQNNSNKGIGPGAVSSLEWRNAIMAKEQKKRLAEEAKNKRMQERIQKKIEKEELQKKKKEEKLRKQQLKVDALKKNPPSRKRATLKRTRVSESSTEEEEWQPSNSESDGMSNDEVERPILNTAEPQSSESCLEDKLDEGMDNLTHHSMKTVIVSRQGQSEDSDLMQHDILGRGQPSETDQHAQTQQNQEDEMSNVEAESPILHTAKPQESLSLKESVSQQGESEERELVQHDPPGQPDADQCAQSEQNQSVVVVQVEPPGSVAKGILDSSSSEVVTTDAVKPEKEAKFFIGCRSTPRNKISRTLFKIEELLLAEEAIVIPLNPCNRYRMVFVENKQQIGIIDLSKIQVTYVPTPVKFGKTGDEKYQFPVPLQVDW